MDNIKTKQSRGKRLLQYIRKNRLIYLMMIPALGCWLLFKVGPLFGMVIALQATAHLREFWAVRLSGWRISCAYSKSLICSR